MGFNPAKQDLDRVARPIGLWLLAACNAAAVVPLAFQHIWVLSILYDPNPADITFGHWAEMLAWALLAILAGVCLFTLGAVGGDRPSRTILLVLLAVISMAALWDSYCFVIWYRSAGYTLSELTWTGLWNGSIGVRYVAWFSLNFWYLLGSRTRRFFST